MTAKPHASADKSVGDPIASIGHGGLLYAEEAGRHRPGNQGVSKRLVVPSRTGSCHHSGLVARKDYMAPCWPAVETICALGCHHSPSCYPRTRPQKGA